MTELQIEQWTWGLPGPPPSWSRPQEMPPAPSQLQTRELLRRTNVIPTDAGLLEGQWPFVGEGAIWGESGGGGVGETRTIQMLTS